MTLSSWASDRSPSDTTAGGRCGREGGLGGAAGALAGGWQMRTVGRLGRGDRRNGGRLHQPGRVRLRARDADRLERVAFVERLADEDAHGLRPVAGLIGK